MIPWDYVQYMLALVFVLALIGLIAVAVGRLGFSGAMGGRRGARIRILETAAVDKRRRLVLIRRDGVEHLVMIGGGRDFVVESDIRHDPAERAGHGPAAETAEPRPAEPRQAEPHFAEQPEAAPQRPAGRREDRGQVGPGPREPAPDRRAPAPRPDAERRQPPARPGPPRSDRAGQAPQRTGRPAAGHDPQTADPEFVEPAAPPRRPEPAGQAPSGRTGERAARVKVKRPPAADGGQARTRHAEPAMRQKPARHPARAGTEQPGAPVPLDGPAVRRPLAPAGPADAS